MFLTSVRIALSDDEIGSSRGQARVGMGGLLCAPDDAFRVRLPDVPPSEWFMKKFLLTSLFAGLLLIAGVRHASAAVLYSNPTTAAQWTNALYYQTGNPANHLSTYLQNWQSSYYGTISTTTVVVSSYSLSGGWDFFMQLYDADGTPKSCTGSYNIAGGSGSNVQMQFVMSGAECSVVTGHNYSWLLSFNNGSGGGSSIDLYSSVTATGGKAIGTAPNAALLVESSDPPTVFLLDLVSPAPSSTVNNDFLNWRLHSSSTAEGDNFTLGVVYSRGSNLEAQTQYPTYRDYQQFQLTPDSPSVSAFLVGKRTPIFQLWNNTSTLVYVRGDIFDAAGTLIGTTGVKTFTVLKDGATITGFGNSSSSLPQFTSSTVDGLTQFIDDTFTVDCSAYDGLGFFDADAMAGFICSLQKMAAFVMRHAIFPHQTTIDFVDGAFSGLTRMFPFNLVFSLSDVTQGVLVGDGSLTGYTTSTIAQYDRLTFQQNTMALGTSTITVLTSSSLASFIGQPAVDKLFQLERAILWILLFLLVVLTIYHKTRKH